MPAWRRVAWATTQSVMPSVRPGSTMRVRGALRVWLPTTFSTPAHMFSAALRFVKGAKSWIGPSGL